MRKSIVLKLFLLITGVCLFIIASIYGVQHFFFEDFYLRQRSEDIHSALNSYQQELLESDSAEDVRQLEYQFYEENNASLGVLDEEGYLKHTDDFYLEVHVLDEEVREVLGEATLHLPLYTLMDAERSLETSVNFPDYIADEGNEITLSGIMIDETFYPQRIARNATNIFEEGRLENRALIDKEYEMVESLGGSEEYFDEYTSVMFHAEVTDVAFPIGESYARYSNTEFIEEIKEWQAAMLYAEEPFPDTNDSNSLAMPTDDYSTLFIESVTNSDGSNSYLLASASLQPVGEASQVMQSYFGYIVLGALLLTILVAFYVSRKIASPLIKLDQMTQQMAELNFSEELPIQSDDEIGNLSRNINVLSSLLQNHISQLEKEIEKEKRLEQTRKDFISGVSHELKTPLSVVESCLYILKDKPNTEKKDYYFQSMEDEVRNMNNLVQDMLELARYDADSYQLEMTTFDIQKSIEKIYQKLKVDSEKKNLQVVKSLQSARVRANRNRIEQVLVNFISNAIRYSPEKESIILSIKEDEEQIKVQIENNGTHISEEQINKIWDQFYRVDDSRHRSTGGTGLGLAISKKILEWHHSPYGVYNTEEGVAFWFKLEKSTKHKI